MHDHTSKILKQISTLIGDAVVIPVKYGDKCPLINGWPKLSIPDTQKPAFLRNFGTKSNFGVVLGEVSDGLCSIDIDSDEDAAYFLQINPMFEGTLHTRGARGLNIWIRIIGEYPPLTQIVHRTLTNEQGMLASIGEWRANGAQTVIYGMHPTGVDYQWKNPLPVTEIRYNQIAWPEDWLSPTEKSDESELQRTFLEKYGSPFFKPKKGTVRINEVFIAAKFAAEKEVLWDPDEHCFYMYIAETGIWRPVTSERIKALFSDDLRDLSRKLNEQVFLTKRTNTLLNSLTELLKSLVERRNVFQKKREKITHLENGMLQLGTVPPSLIDFSPEFCSRNYCPLPYDEDAECPRFLSELLETALDKDDIDLIQRYCGAILLGGNAAQKILVITGTAGGGKSTLVDIIERCVGRVNIVELRPSHLDDRFEIARFIGKRVLTGKDVPSHFFESSSASALKKLVGHDSLSAEKKGSNSTFELKGDFDVIVTSNSRLRVMIDSDIEAWRRRLLIIRYDRPKPERPIRNYGDELFDSEGPGILAWMVEGALKHLNELEEEGDFRLSVKQEARINHLLNESDSVRCFVVACLKKQSDCDVTTNELFESYGEFCAEMTWQPLPLRKFESEMPDVVMEVLRVARRNDIKRNEKNQRGYFGVCYVKPSEIAQYEANAA
jgi:P4 family phage/plasmid primase-like protien